MKNLYKIEDAGVIYCTVDLLYNGKVKKQVFHSTKASVNSFEHKIKPYINDPDPRLVNVYKFKKLSAVSYYYIMDYLPYGLSSEEEDLVINLLDNNFSFEKTELECPKLIKRNQKLWDFIINSQTIYCDVHEQNIRKTANLEYKWIDYEGLY